MSIMRRATGPAGRRVLLAAAIAAAWGWWAYAPLRPLASWSSIQTDSPWPPVWPRVSPDGATFVEVSDRVLRSRLTGAEPNHMLGPVRLWDLPSGRERVSIPNTGDTDRRAVLGPDGSWLLVHCMRLGLTLWDARTGELRAELRPPNKIGSGNGYVTVYAVSQDGRFIAADRVDCEAVGVWDTATGRRVAEIVGARSPFALSGDGEKLLAAVVGPNNRPRRTAKLWHLPSGRELLTFPSHRWPVGGVAVSPDGRLLATGGKYYFDPGDSTPDTVAVRLWEAATGRAVATVPMPTGSGFRFSPDGRLLLGGFFGHGLIRDVAETPPRNRDDLIAITKDSIDGKSMLSPHYGPHYAAGGMAWFAMAPDGRSLAVATEPSETPRLLSLPRFRGGDSSFRANVWPPTPVFAHGGRVLAVPVQVETPQYRFNNPVLETLFGRFRSAGRWSMVQAYDVASGEPLAATPPVPEAIHVMGFTPDGESFWTQRVVDDAVPGTDATRVFELWPVRPHGLPGWLPVITVLAAVLLAIDVGRNRRRVALSVAAAGRYPPIQGGPP